MPVSGAKQRECLKFLAENILSDKSFQFSPSLLRRLGAERWMHWGNESMFGPGIDISVLEKILGIQKIVLGQCLSSGTLARLQNQQLQADPGSDPLRMDEVFRALTDGIWSDLDKLPDPKDAKGAKIALSSDPPQPPARVPPPAWQHGPGRSDQLGRRLVHLRRLPRRRQPDGAGRRPRPGAAAPQGDRRPDRHGAGNQERQPGRHQPGSPRGVPSTASPRSSRRISTSRIPERSGDEPKDDVPPGLSPGGPFPPRGGCA